MLFIGLAVDFGIQFSVRLHAMQRSDRPFAATLHEAAAQGGGQIGLAALAISCGFLAFAPTHFTGVAELGIIAGVGMLLALLCTLTILPALLALLVSGPQHADVALPGGARADVWLQRQRRPVLIAFALLALAGLGSALTIPFDANPLHTKNPHSEAMRTLNSLMDDPQTNPFAMNVLVADLPAARALAARLDALPEVAQVVSGADFVPQEQDDKLEQIEQASDLMLSVQNPASVAPSPTAAELRAATTNTRDGIASVANQLAATSPLLRIGRALGRLASAPDAMLLTANGALSQFLPSTLTQLNNSLSAERITLQNLAPDLKRDWFTADGRVRVQVTPTAKAQGTGGLRGFVAAVLAVAPQAAGSALDTIGAADTVLEAFVQAALSATIAIALVLLLTLRRIRDAALVLVTLLMSALLTALLVRLAVFDQLRQHHRPAAAAGRRRVVQRLFRDELAQRPAPVPGFADRARHPVLGADHRHRVRHPGDLAPSRHRQHGSGPAAQPARRAARDLRVPARRAVQPVAPRRAGAATRVIESSPAGLAPPAAASSTGPDTPCARMPIPRSLLA